VNPVMDNNMNNDMNSRDSIGFDDLEARLNALKK
jgi:hypothetical protein